MWEKWTETHSAMAQKEGIFVQLLSAENMPRICLFHSFLKRNYPGSISVCIRKCHFCYFPSHYPHNFILVRPHYFVVSHQVVTGNLGCCRASCSHQTRRSLSGVNRPALLKGLFVCCFLSQGLTISTETWRWRALRERCPGGRRRRTGCTTGSARMRTPATTRPARHVTAGSPPRTGTRNSCMSRTWITEGEGQSLAQPR